MTFLSVFIMLTTFPAKVLRISPETINYQIREKEIKN